MFKDRIWILDGAMGTALMNKGLKVNYAPELLNIEHPDIIIEVHREYMEAGAGIIETNTFGSNRVKLSHFGLEDKVEELTASGVRLAKRASNGKALVALSVGPTGVFVEPVGDMSFDEMVDVFKEQIGTGAEAGADLILIETMSDIKEAKAAVIAARDVCNLPVIVSMTYQSDGRTLLGTPPEVSAAVFEGLDVAALGSNCSLGPEAFPDIIRRTASITEKPIIAYANAGLPMVKGGKTIYPETPESFAKYAPEFVKAGANIIGGCCGTTPEHIRAIRNAVKGMKPVKRNPVRGLKTASRTRLVLIGSEHRTIVIGERINPTGRRKMQKLLKNGDLSIIASEAKKQVEQGAEILDVNVGLPGIDEPSTMEKAVRLITETVDVPIMIDSKNPEAIEKALKVCAGKPIVNSCSAESKDLTEILPLVKRFGANVVALAIGDEGLKRKAEDRIDVVKRILSKCKSSGIPNSNVIVDVLNLAVSAMPKASIETLKALRMVKEKLSLPTTLGVSNVSFGLPNRSIINASFISMATEAGLDAGIVNPGDKRVMESIYASDVLTSKDKGASIYVDKFKNYKAGYDEKCTEILRNICKQACSILSTEESKEPVKKN